MDLTGIGTAVVGIGGKLIDKLFPDPAEKAKAQAMLIELQQSGELRELETRMSAIIAEAKSADPWTSRARPSFMYVIYVMILFSIPMGIVAAFAPTQAMLVAEGMKAWLSAIPDGLWATFGIGYTGYSVARSMDKRNIAKG
ncbi:MAG: holin family protein [Desulfuromonadales bacterium]|nr:holin family protein [Desulfuromonadales bacterium]